MTTTLEIITSAYRESNLIAIGASPSAPQVTEGLARLNALVSGVYGYEVGDPLADWPVGVEGVADDVGSWDSNAWSYPPANVRLIAGHTSATTVYLPPAPDDGARVVVIDPNARLAAAPITLDGNGRAIEGATSVTLSANSLERSWLYRADKGNWTRLSTLTATDDEEFPFPIEFDDYFITRLAMRINPRYGRSIGAESADAMERTLGKLRARYRQKKSIMGEPGPASLTRGYGAGYNPASSVNRNRGGWMA